MKIYLSHFLIEKISTTSNHISFFGLFLYFLTFLSKIYEKLIILWAKNQLKKPLFNAKVKIISVGNITSGGTGKTPLVGWLAKYLDEKGINTGIVLRGYGRTKKIKYPILLGKDFSNLNEVDYFGDEALLLRELSPHSEIVVSQNRILAIQKLQNETNCEVIILDDGFQQLKIKKDWNIVCLDPKKPFGNGYLIPRGVLREPLSALERASHFVFSKGTPRKRIFNKVNEVLKDKTDSVFCCEYKIHGAYLLEDPLKIVTVSQLQEENLLVISGIGNPESFYSALAALDIDGEHKIFPDHYNFQSNDIDDINAYIEEQNITGIIVTEKDSMKLKNFHFNVPCFVVETELLPPIEFINELSTLIKDIQKR